MDELVRVVRVAVLAQDRLGDAAALDLNRHRLVAHVALEERLPHLRNQRRCANHQPIDRDQFIYVCKGESRAISFKVVTFIQVSIASTIISGKKCKTI